MNMLNYRTTYPYDNNLYSNYPSTTEQNGAFPQVYPPTNYISPPLSQKKSSPTNQPKTNEIRKNISPSSTPYYAPRSSVPPPIIYSYPNEDLWSFYGTPTYNPIPYIPTEPNMQTYYYDYDRRPPKSTELFDPNAPEKKHPRPFSGSVLEDLKHMQNFPRSPSHDSFFNFHNKMDITLHPQNQKKILNYQSIHLQNQLKMISLMELRD